MAEEPVVIRRFRDLIEAELAKGRLESAGIPSFVADENIVSIDGFYSNAIGGLRLLVEPQDAQAALTILDEPIPEEIVEEDSGLTSIQHRCRGCGSLDVSFETLDRAMGYSRMFLNIPCPVGKHNWKCHQCGAEWVDD